MKKLMGNKAYVFFDTVEPSRVIHGITTPGTGEQPVITAPKTWYYVVGRGEPSGVPLGFITGGIFRSPSSGQQLTLFDGDRVMPIDQSRFCKTSADYSVEQGTVDVGDDCDPGATLELFVNLQFPNNFH